MNRVMLLGNLVRDPEEGKGGENIAKMRLAVNNRRKRGDEWVEEPNYFNVTAFGGLGENCLQYLEKGRQVAVEGRLHWHAWETEDGQRREAVEVIAQHVQFLGSPRQSEDEEPTPGGGEPPDPPPPASSPQTIASPPIEGGDDEPPGF